MQVLRSEDKLLVCSHYDHGTLWERMDTNETKQHVTGLSETATSGGAAAICLRKRSSTCRPKFGHARCRLIWFGRGHETDQARGGSSQESGRGRASAGSSERIVGTAAHRLEDTAESTTISEQESGKREGSSAESAKKKQRKQTWRSLLHSPSKNRRTKKQREYSPNSAHSNKKLT